MQTLGCLATQVQAMDKQSNTHSHVDTLGKPRNSGGKGLCPLPLCSIFKNEEGVFRDSTQFQPSDPGSWVTPSGEQTPQRTCVNSSADPYLIFGDCVISDGS